MLGNVCMPHVFLDIFYLYLDNIVSCHDKTLKNLLAVLEVLNFLSVDFVRPQSRQGLSTAEKLFLLCCMGYHIVCLFFLSLLLYEA